jgi:hypothetical protein
VGKDLGTLMSRKRKSLLFNEPCEHNCARALQISPSLYILQELLGFFFKVQKYGACLYANIN